MFSESVHVLGSRINGDCWEEQHANGPNLVLLTESSAFRGRHQSASLHRPYSIREALFLLCERPFFGRVFMYCSKKVGDKRAHSMLLHSLTTSIGAELGSANNELGTYTGLKVANS